MDKKILKNQILTDLENLEKDLRAGLYLLTDYEGLRDFLEARDRIMRKEWMLEEMEKKEEAIAKAKVIDRKAEKKENFKKKNK